MASAQASFRESPALQAWLVRTTGHLAGTRYPIRQSETLVGRGPQNHILIEDDAKVSVMHLKIHKRGDSYELEDLDSTNGTYINGVLTKKATLEAPCSIQLGLTGPQLSFVLDHSIPFEPEETLESTGAPHVTTGDHEGIVAEALARIRLGRGRTRRDRSRVILREMIDKAVSRTSRRARVVITGLVLALLVLAGVTAWKVNALRTEKQAIDKRILQVEALLQAGGQNPEKADQLMDELNRYQRESISVANTVLYRYGVREERNPVEEELKALMTEFGAETYRFPPEFLGQVERFVRQYQGPDRVRITAALGSARKDIEMMRAVFQEQQLPPDLAYMAVIESALGGIKNRTSGAVGAWQFMPPTARAFGLVVDGRVDERLDVRKSTLAASKLMRELILDFGAGGSVMLAIAAYNGGQGKVKQAVRTVKDPIKQRNFWYLYRIGALPLETREYVPKVLAVMIIFRNPSRFGF